MANVLNPETESITLNTELETPTLEPATEHEQPLPESTSTPETAPEQISAEASQLDADTTHEEMSEIRDQGTETADQAAPAAQAEQHTVAESAHGPESAEDFSAALEAFEREQAAEAAAVEAYGDKVVSGTVIKQTEKHLVVDVGLKSEGLVPGAGDGSHRRGEVQRGRRDRGGDRAGGAGGRLPRELREGAAPAGVGFD